MIGVLEELLSLSVTVTGVLEELLSTSEHPVRLMTTGFVFLGLPTVLHFAGQPLPLSFLGAKGLKVWSVATGK